MGNRLLIRNKNFNLLLSLFIFFLLIYYIILIFSGPFTIFHSDPLNGFLALKNFLRGGSFNYIESVRAVNVSQHNVEFLTWWSPGQYMIPYLFEKLLHFSFINSMRLTVVTGMIVFVPGVICLFRYLKFGLQVSLICVIIFLIQRVFLIDTWGYDGGDFLSMSVFPWFLLGFLVISDSKNPAFQFPGIIILTLVGVFIKLTFIVFSISFLFFLFISSIAGKKNLNYNIRSVFSRTNLSVGLGIMTIALVSVYFSFSIQENQSKSIQWYSFKVERFHRTVIHAIVNIFFYRAHNISVG